MNRKLLALIILGIIPVIVLPIYAADPSEKFTFQGVLKDSSSNLVTATKDITLDFYTASSGGTLRFSNLCNDTSVSSGLFTCTITNPYDNFFAQALFVEVKVADSDGANSETLTPRIELVGAPYSISSLKAGNNFDLLQNNLINVTSITTESSINMTLVSDFTVDTRTFTVEAADNQVGIGTTNPSEILEVFSTGIENAQFTIDAAGGSPVGDTRIRIGQSGTGADLNGIIGWDFSEKQMQLYVSGESEGTSLNIDNGGKIGIGTTDPASALYIAGPTGSDITPNVKGFQFGVTDSSSNVHLDITGDGGTPYIDWKNDIGTGDNDFRMILVGDDLMAFEGGALFVGSTSETIANSEFVANTNDLFVADMLGVETAIVTDGYINATAIELAQTGTAIAMNVTNTGSGEAFVVYDSAPSSDTTLFVIDELGDVGIGTTNPSQKLDIFDAGESTNPIVRITDTADPGNNRILALRASDTSPTSSDRYIDFLDQSSNSEGSISGDGSGGITIASTAALNVTLGSTSDFTIGDRTFTVDSENNRVGIGTTNPSVSLDVRNGRAFFSADAGDSTSVVSITDTGSNTNDRVLVLKLPDDTPASTDYFIQFLDANSATDGQIRGNGGNVAYDTSSDERLKENIVNTAYSIDDLMNLQVRDYNFIGVNQTKTGFMAQELYQVYPEVVGVGGDDPNIQPWSVDYGLLTPLLVKAIQEQQSQIEQLKQIVCTDHPEAELCQ